MVGADPSARPNRVRSPRRVLPSPRRPRSARRGQRCLNRDVSDSRVQTRRHGASMAGVRSVVPPHQRAHRSHVRALREHLRPAGGGSGWRRRAHRQPPRARDAGQNARASLPGSERRTGPRTPSSQTRRAAAEQLRREGVPAAKIRVIPNGVDCALLAARMPAAADSTSGDGRQPPAGEGPRHAHPRCLAHRRRAARHRVSHRR